MKINNFFISKIFQTSEDSIGRNEVTFLKEEEIQSQNVDHQQKQQQQHHLRIWNSGEVSDQASPVKKSKPCEWSYILGRRWKQCRRPIGEFFYLWKSQPIYYVIAWAALAFITMPGSFVLLSIVKQSVFRTFQNLIRQAVLWWSSSSIEKEVGLIVKQGVWVILNNIIYYYFISGLTIFEKH